MGFMRWLWFSIIVLTCFSCRDDEEAGPLIFPDLMEVPAGFPPVDFPEGNEFTDTRWALGKKLFFDPVLSVDSSISCASCHLPELAFSDDQRVSIGVENRPGTRNSPSLANVAYHPYFTREGGVPTLEMQVLVPIQEHNEFDFNIVLAAERLAADSTYVQMSAEAYDRQPDPFVITRSLANFERSLLSGNSRFDQYFYQNKEGALSRLEQEGLELFFSEKTNCSKCHEGFNFTNYTFKNNGLYEEYEDVGRFRLTGEEVDRAMFKIPGLRNVGLTAPFMHDGALATLEEVVDHYDKGGEAHPHKSDLIRPLGLTDEEKQALVRFLESLTDETFINNPIFKN